MRIAVDGYDLTRQPTGVGRFLRNLLPPLLAMDRENSYHLFLREDARLAAGPGRLETTVIPGTGGYTRWQNLDLGRQLARGRFDLLFAPNGQLPFLFRGRSVLVVHDVSWKAIPGDFSRRERTAKDLKCRWSLNRAARVCTPAEFTRKELVERYRVPADKIQAIPLAIEPGFDRANAAQIAAFKDEHGLQGKKVIGFLGSIFGRRHVRELVMACDRLRENHELALVIVGRNAAGAGMAGWLRRQGVVWIDWLPEQRLNAFYSALDLFVYISEYEGFGFPPLEALACGTVSLLLPTSSLWEMYRQLALFVETAAPDAVAGAIQGFLADQDAVTRRTLSAWEERKNYFSWERVASAYLRTMAPL
jgi:glycosyltransferase involved in cell wall biosynthesis